MKYSFGKQMKVEYSLSYIHMMEDLSKIGNCNEDPDVQFSNADPCVSLCMHDSCKYW